MASRCEHLHRLIPWPQENRLKSESVNHSVVSDSLRPHGLQPARLLCPWNSPGKNTGVGCHFLLQGIVPPKNKSWISWAAGGFFPIWFLAFLAIWFFTVFTSSPAPLSMEFSRQESWSEKPFPSPGDLPNPGIEPGSPALKADSLFSEPPENTL